MNFKISPKKVILSTFAATLITLASFRYVIPVGAVRVPKGEMYSLTGLNGFILLNFFVALVVVFIAISLLQKSKKIQFITRDNKVIDPFIDG